MLNETQTALRSTCADAPFARRGRGLLAAAVAAAAAAIICAPSAARADDYSQGDSVSPTPTPRERSFGFGSAFGGGVTAASAVSNYGDHVSATAPYLLLPTMEIQVFFAHEYSLDLSMPVTNMIVASSAVHGFAFNMDAFFNANVGEGTARLVIGPGIGFSVLASDLGSASTFRLPAQIGLEVLTSGRGFGFKVLARPFAEFGVGSAATVAGGGFVAAVAFSGYSTHAKQQAVASR